MPVPPTSYGSKHPLASSSEARQLHMAMAMLRRKFGHMPRKVWAIDLDRIAYVDHEGLAKTAFLVERSPDYWTVGTILDGWPVSEPVG